MKALTKLISFAVLWGALGFLTASSVWAGAYAIELDGEPFAPSQPIYNVNDRIMVPLRNIGEAMGAKFQWDEATGAVTMHRGSLYAILTIGSTTMQHGQFLYAVDGAFSPVTTLLYYLDSAPVIIGNSTYIPVRAVAEALGAEVYWDDTDGTAYITSKAVSDPETIQLSDYASTTYFINTTASAVKREYENIQNDFWLAIYNSTHSHSVDEVKAIITTADELKTKIYALDIAQAGSYGLGLAFIYDATGILTINPPALFYIEENSAMHLLEQPYGNDLADRMQSYMDGKIPLSGSAGIADSAYIKDYKPEDILEMAAGKSNFLVLLYDSRDEAAMASMQKIKPAAESLQYTVYSLDIKSSQNYATAIPWMSGYKNVPVLFMVEEGKFIKAYEAVDTGELMETYIRKFISAYGRVSAESTYPDFESVKNYSNIDLKQLVQLLQDNKGYVLLLYDSRDYGSLISVRDTIALINEHGYSYDAFYYGYNEATELNGLYYTQREIDNFEDILETKFENYKRPVLVYIYNYRIYNYVPDLSDSQAIIQFLQSNGK